MAETQGGDTPYIIILDPHAFHELLSTYEDSVHAGQHTMTGTDRQLAERVLQQLRKADETHVCIDEVEESGTAAGHPLQFIYLTNPHDPISILGSSLVPIQAIVAETKICSVCKQLFHVDKPEVVKNLCLQCLLNRQQHKLLGFARSVVQKNYKGEEERAFWFLDYFGQIIVTTAGLDEHNLQVHPYETLHYWGFPVPERGMVNETEQDLPHWYWKIHGDQQTWPVVLLENTLDHHGTTSVFFLSTRGGTSEQVYKRKGKLRALLIEARRRLEASKDAEGYYHIGDRKSYQLYDGHLLETAAQLASAAIQPNLFSAVSQEESAHDG